MPKVIPADREKMEILKIIEKKEKLPVLYRMKRPLRLLKQLTSTGDFRLKPPLRYRDL